MVLFGFVLLAVFAVSLWHTAREAHGPTLAAAASRLWSMPLAVDRRELGWFVAEFGRQPWIIDGVLPTFLATSELGVSDLVLTISALPRSTVSLPLSKSADACRDRQGSGRRDSRDGIGD